MSSELTILALYGLVCIVTLLIHVLTGQGQLGLPYLVSPRDDPRDVTGVAGRAKRASENSITAMALFAPAILILQAKSGFTPTTLLAAQAFLVARIAYPIVYMMGTHWVRTAIWLVGFLATALLYVLAL